MGPHGSRGLVRPEKIYAIEPPSPPELIARVRALPAAGPLLSRLGDGSAVHLVGGAVRDLLLGGTPPDLDLVVEGDAAALAASLGGRLRVHDRFGTSTVVLGGFTYDIARARTESYAHPGALPDVAPASLAEDLGRRDFTVNAIAIALGPPQPGQLNAVPAALEDLHGRRLRVLHDQSFIDDPTRLFRLARYASRLAFEIEPQTRALVDDAQRSEALKTVSGARIGAELRLLAREPDPTAALHALAELGLDKAIDPRLDSPDPAMARRALELLPAEGRADLVALALAAWHIPEADLRALLDALAFEAADRDVIVAVATRAGQAARALQLARSASEVADALANQPVELAALAGALGAETQARDWLCKHRHVRLEISGDDLLAAGIPEGPAIGRGLRAALAAKLDGAARGRKAELEEAVRAAGGNG